VKRAFERDGDTLVDRYVVEGSTKETSTHFPRSVLLGVVKRRRPLAAPSPTRVRRWVKRLLAGEWAALHDVVEHRDVPGVREALVAAAEGPLSAAEIVTTALGQVGGVGAREVLRREVAALVKRPATFRAAKFTNTSARRLTTLARDVLRMDPEAVDAAAALVRLFKHPVPDNRMYSAWNAAELYAQWNAPRTKAHATLRDGLAPLLRTRDADVFVKVIPALWEMDPNATRARVARLLKHTDPWVRHEAAQQSLKARSPRTWELVAMVVAWLETEPSLRLVAEFANTTAHLVPAERLRDIVARALADESPSLRYDGLSLLASLDATARDELARDALRDEPDADLKRLLRRRLLRKA
jgi:hypothetical protein